ncbi:threonylcarbamoyl-AMP synthase [Brucella sp. BO3]|uniref:L-threonylcarbamoyladenylate synthase n=1 Tax=unclassified Brucella TaxID=2632610 RepID=UPI00084F9BCC|nr:MULTISPECIES: L-threonylcarbamoyladenylate synthase [unclassified Brucella]OEI82299.1 threonylcarbamoyl-AMP synthase [Brucella sp. B13-0095]QMV25768.1 threonylcarbamoyl-AMP synthase [Brucella sp. BO3]
MTETLKFDDWAVLRAVEVLRRGGLVAIPTETVYGLAADAANGEGVAGIFAAKGRPQFNPLIAHVDGIAMAGRYVAFDPVSRRLAEAFWPGPLTIVLPLKERQDTDRPIHPLVTAGLSTLAVRMPHGRVRDVITALDSPVAAPSANTSGRISPTSAAAVAGDLGGRIDLILDAGPCDVGVESTIVKVDGDQVHLLRPGGLAAEEIEAFLGQKLRRAEHAAAIQAPGMMESHYAPDASMRLAVSDVKPGEALLAFGPHRVAESNRAAAVLNLSATGDLREAAANLFDFMRRLDATGAATIAVEPIPLDGLGEAINDRLKRAAAPR